MPPAAEVIVFPDPVDLAISVIPVTLGASLTAPVVGRVPENRPSRFIRVRLVGGVRESMVSRQATLAVEGWAQTETDALALCEIGTAALYAQEGQMFGGFEIAGPAYLPDPTTSQERYSATVGIRVRGSKLA